MKLAAVCLLLAVAFCLQSGAEAGLLFGSGSFRSVQLPTTLSFTPAISSIPLADGLSLQGTTAYVRSQPVPASTCLTTALGLFTNCQPFVQDLTAANGTISTLTILQLLVTASNRTASTECFNATLNFLNQGCVCSQQVATTVQALPTTSIPQLLKTFLSLLTRLFCPNGLVNQAPPAPTVTSTVPAPPIASTVPTLPAVTATAPVAAVAAAPVTPIAAGPAAASAAAGSQPLYHVFVAG